MNAPLGRATLAGLLAVACGGLHAFNPDGEIPGDADTDADSDSDVDTDADTDTDTDSDRDPLDIDSVEPEHGSSGGGTDVIIRGGPFDASAVVTFNGEPATVQSYSTSQLSVVTPDGDPGYADVAVTTDTHTGEMSSGFLYWLDGSGLDGALGSLSLYHWTGNYWAEGTIPDEAYADVFFIEPTNLQYWELYTDAMDTCRSNFSFNGTVGVYYPGVSSMTLEASSGTPITLTENPDYAYIYEATITTSQYIQNGSYTLSSPSASEWPEFEAESFVRAAGSYSITYPDINGDTPPTFNYGNLTFNWSGSGGDYMLMRLLRYNGSSVIEEVSCAMTDDGSFIVPSSVWAGWTADQQLTVIMGRARRGTGTIPFNNSDTAAIGVYWIIGAGFTQ